MTHRADPDIPADDRALGLYVHVPFCRSKCRYCDFCSRPPAPGDMDRYACALEAETRLGASNRPVRTLYVGGGTPSFIGSDRLNDILHGLRRAFRLQPDCEITVEANPCDLSSDWLADCRAAGVNRLSVGVQGMRDKDLRFLGRAHTVADAIAGVQRARAAGFDNLGIDLIVGLPGHSAGITREILTRAVAAFAPEHLSCYQLTCAPGTPLHEAVARGEVRMPDADTEAAIFMATHDTCEGLGYEGYEVSNFARTAALRSRHNSAYWTHRDYLGFGPSAHSFLNPVRSWTTASLAEYCASLERGELPEAGRERLTDAQRATEIILLGLRTRDGFSLEELRESCGVDLWAEKGAALVQAESDGLLHRKANRIEPTLKGMAVADRLACDLAPETILDRGDNAD
jgi:putative oxygen-independent coproporphyrinogen III oxidase